MLLADSTWLFFSSLCHESLCLESSQERLIWLMILSLELGTLGEQQAKETEIWGGQALLGSHGPGPRFQVQHPAAEWSWGAHPRSLSFLIHRLL